MNIEAAVTTETTTPVTTPAPTGRVRKPLTAEQRARKNAKDKARRAAKKAAKVVVAKAATKRAAKKVSKKTHRQPVLREDTIYRAIVKFLQRPAGATHAEIAKKFGLAGPDERGRFWHLINTYGYPIRKDRLPADSKREGRKVFSLPKNLAGRFNVQATA